jgi:hypothetical protein
LRSSGSPRNCNLGGPGLKIKVIAIESSGRLNFFLGGMVCPQGFACHISSVILTDIILTVLETVACFLSNVFSIPIFETNYMHILASGPE